MRLLRELSWSPYMDPIPAGTGGYVAPGIAPEGFTLVFFGSMLAHAAPIPVPTAFLELDTEEAEYMKHHPGELPV